MERSVVKKGTGLSPVYFRIHDLRIFILTRIHLRSLRLALLLIL